MSHQPKILKNARREDEAHRRLLEIRQEEIELQLEAANLLARIKKSKHHALLGMASIGEFGESIGYSEYAARRLVNVAEAVKKRPELAEDLRAGTLTLAAVVSLLMIIRRSALRKETGKWIATARKVTTKELIRGVRARLEELALRGDSPVHVSIYTSGRAKDLFLRAKKLRARQLFRPVTDSEAFEAVSRHFVESFDPLVQGASYDGYVREPRATRYITASVRREVMSRTGGRCAVPGCENAIFLEFAHIVPYRVGGEQGADNLILLCCPHHALFDRGYLVLEGTADIPRFRNRFGQVMGTVGALVSPPPAAPP